MITTLADAGEIVPIVAIVGGLVIAVIAIVFGAVKSMVVGTARERSRREIAAYVAEGSMSPDEGARLMDAGKKIGEA